jgi:hypothetical protein
MGRNKKQEKYTSIRAIVNLLRWRWPNAKIMLAPMLGKISLAVSYNHVQTFVNRS